MIYVNSLLGDSNIIPMGKRPNPEQSEPFFLAIVCRSNVTIVRAKMAIVNYSACRIKYDISAKCQRIEPK